MEKYIPALFLVLFFVAGCATTGDLEEFGPELVRDRFGEETLSAEISRNLKDRSFKSYPVIVTTFVSLNELDKSSVFGRMMAEKLLHFMNKNGFNVVEVRRAQDLFIKKEVGEMILTRDISELAQLTKAKSVLAGTYVATSNALIINARLIDINTPRILSSYSYEVAMTDEVISLLTGESPF